jgi:hypothetical protein
MKLRTASRPVIDFQGVNEHGGADFEALIAVQLDANRDNR